MTDPSPIGRRLGAGRHPALLVVDATEGFTRPGSPLSSDMRTAVAAIAALLAAARDAARPVAYTRVAYREPLSAGARLFRQKVPALHGLEDGSAAARIDPEIAPRDGELVLRKELASAFAGTELPGWVHDHGIDTLVVAGASTSGCVRATVVDGLQRGIRMLVPREAVGDRDPRSHAVALSDIDGRYGDVLPLAAALELLCPTTTPEVIR